MDRADREREDHAREWAEMQADWIETSSRYRRVLADALELAQAAETRIEADAARRAAQQAEHARADVRFAALQAEYARSQAETARLMAPLAALRADHARSQADTACVEEEVSARVASLLLQP